LASRFAAPLKGNGAAAPRPQSCFDANGSASP
jgi:hypothetical protein